MTDQTKNPASIDRLLDIMARLRDPMTGCPWDVAQNHATIAPYTIEEAYEVADAIQRGDMDAFRDELGDLLFQVVFYAQMAREEGAFDFDAVAAGVSDKMERRHPHVFGEADVDSPEAQTTAWEVHKAAERAADAASAGREPSVLDGVALALPALMRAYKLQRRAAREGFDWPDIAPVIAKIEEELGEIRMEITQGGSHDRMEDEVGDLLFAVVNLARHLNVDAEHALRRTNAKFESRFRDVERGLAGEGKALTDATLDEMDAHWERSKLKERSKKTI